MNDSKLIQALQTFSEVELFELNQLVTRQNRTRAQNLFQCICPLLNTDKGIEKEAVFKQLYPNKLFNDQRMREDMSLLYIEVQQYLMEQELQGRIELQQQLLLPQLRKRGLIKDLQYQLHKSTTRLQDETEQTEAVFLEAFHLAEEGDQLFGLKQTRQYDANLQNKVDNLDRFYLVKKLKESCEILNRQNIISTAYTVHLEAEMLAIIQKNYAYLNLPILKVYYHIYKTLKNTDSETEYEQLVELLNSQYHLFSKDEARNMYRYAQNYCIRQINKGQQVYFNKLFQLYLQLLNSGVILKNDALDQTDYKNIATVALRVGEQAWTRNFLENYKDKLPDEYRDAAYKLNLASYYYDIADYENAAELLINARFDDIFYSLSARHLLLKVFYDQGEFEAFTYQLESFKVYLGRNKMISTDNKLSNINFLKVCRRLGALKQSVDYIADKEIAKRINGIEAIIAQYNPLANKVWLTQKIEGLKSQSVI